MKKLALLGLLLSLGVFATACNKDAKKPEAAPATPAEAPKDGAAPADTTPATETK